jgi:hypothetical protein
MADIPSNIVKLPRKIIKRHRGRNKGYQIKSRGNSHTVVIRLKQGSDTRTFDDLEMANDWAQKRVQEIKYSQEPSVKEKKLKGCSIRSLIEDYIAYVPHHDFIGHKPRKRSWEADKVRLQRICANHPWLVDKPLSSLADDDFNRWRNDRLNGHVVSKVGADTFIQEVSSIKYILYHYARTVKSVHVPKFNIDLPQSTHERINEIA